MTIIKAHGGMGSIAKRCRLLEEKAVRRYIDGYDELANAIVLQAVKDYRAALQALEKRPDHPAGLKVKKECDGFFHSWWYSILTDADPDFILDGLRREVAI